MTIIRTLWRMNTSQKKSDMHKLYASYDIEVSSATRFDVFY